MNEATKKLAMALAVMTIAGCGTMSHRDRDTVVGAGGRRRRGCSDHR